MACAILDINFFGRHERQQYHSLEMQNMDSPRQCSERRAQRWPAPRPCVSPRKAAAVLTAATPWASRATRATDLLGRLPAVGRLGRMAFASNRACRSYCGALLTLGVSHHAPACPPSTRSVGAALDILSCIRPSVAQRGLLFSALAPGYRRASGAWLSKMTRTDARPPLSALAADDN